jgi:diaminohydroxyphosphoribosylaminopyrimidine deaminase/5-amino-6-(5-phosphoribosylamino)uracil reductase
MAISERSLSDEDVRHMRRALFLAERGRGTTSPNPIVGAVIVSADDVVVAQGAHRVAGGPHAEVIALEEAGAHARGATLYCTLEPCSLTGRTGPCCERVVAAGIARVVIATGDPNPDVNGRGIAYLRNHGVQVDLAGVDQERTARRQNAAFFTWVSKGRPHVTLKTAVSSDGFAGLENRPSKLTGIGVDRVMHRQRAEVDAVAVGSSTILVDDPQLTARLVYRERPLTRVIFDRRGRVPTTARVFATTDAGPVLVTGASIPEALVDLAAREIVSVLVEGGPALHRAFWDADVVDRVQVIETSTVLGGGVEAFRPPQPPDAERRRIGDDLLITWDVHRTH